MTARRSVRVGSVRRGSVRLGSIRRSGVSSFEARFDTTQAGSTAGQLFLPFTPNVDNLTDWGDGVVDNLNYHTYAGTPTDATVKVIGTIDDWRYDNGGDKSKLIEQISLGPDFRMPANSVWRGCNNMVWSVPANNTPVIETTNLDSTFLGSVLFDGDISQWDLAGAGVTRVVNFFFGCSSHTGINIEKLDVSTVENFTQMMFGNSVFNVPIGVWNMISATNIGGILRSCTIFNQPLNAWNVSNVITANHVFAGTSYNQPLNLWDTRNFVTFHAMFGSPFNQDLSTWRFDSALDVSWMFAGNTAFNYPIGDGNFPLATNMSNMLGSASSYDQNMSTWLIPNVSNTSTMLDNCGLSQANYDGFLVACAAQPVKSSNTLGAQGLSYTAAGAGGTARTSLATVDLWTFLGDIAT